MNIHEQLRMNSSWLWNEAWEQTDRHLRAVEESNIRFQHLEAECTFKPGTINIIRGPRQIGKTTECKLVIRNRILAGSPTHKLIYFPCDNLLNRRELIDVVQAAKEIAEPKAGQPLTLFLDEITAVKQWDKTVKWLKDTGLLSNVALILTGSSAQEMKRGYERMPGRREGGTDICLLPMSFAKFSGIVSGTRVAEMSLWEMIGSAQEFMRMRSDLLARQSDFSRWLTLHLRYGGFPQVVAEIKKSMKVADPAREIFLSIISSEIEKQRRSTATLRMLLNGIYGSLATPISLNRIAATQNIPSVNTVREYLEILHSSFICFPVAPLDISKKAPFPKKNRKYYFTDPMFLEAVRSAFSLRPLDMPALAESAVAVMLIRHYSREWARWGHVDSLFHWRSSSNREVDFVIRRDSAYFGIEVKYQSAVSGWDELSISRGIGKGLLITRDTFEYGAIPKIPLWAFLLLQT